MSFVRARSPKLLQALVAGVLLSTTLATGVPAALASSTSNAPSKYAPVIHPADFGGPIDNPYLPLIPGSRWVYEEQSADGTEHIVVEVTPFTKKILGVTTVVVRDTATVGGQVIEDTADWYAQDRKGNVWYFGEASMKFADGQPSSPHGSWEAGVDGAQPGIAMPAHPRLGTAYRQEFFKGVSEDQGKVVSIDATAVVPFGTFDHLVETKDFTALEPTNIEHKYYARGIGSVLETSNSGGRGELIEFTKPTK